MATKVDLYDTSYSHYAAEVQRAVRRETYSEDIGQTGWMTTEEFRRFLRLLALDDSSNVLEVGSGSGGCALFMSQQTGCRVTGIDINDHGIRNADALMRKQHMEARVHFECLDASRPLPFEAADFDAVFSNDAVCHIPDRASLLKEWWRVVKPGGRILFTDAMIVSGIVSHEEIAARSSIGFYLFVPPGENERLMREAGFEVLSVFDLTDSTASTSSRWYEARNRRRDELLKIEGEVNFTGLQSFLAATHKLSAERRLLRCAYLGRKQGGIS
jgi:ubiquinone/menaquinone biosynthesis C-methylase UbiE